MKSLVKAKHDSKPKYSSTNQKKSMKKCLYCNQGFSKKKEFEAHMKKKHKEKLITKPMKKCLYCNQWFPQRKEFRAHMKQSHKDKLISWYLKNSRTNDKKASDGGKRVKLTFPVKKSLTNSSKASDIIRIE